jgi:hypothetical protein
MQQSLSKMGLTTLPTVEAGDKKISVIDFIVELQRMYGRNFDVNHPEAAKFEDGAVKTWSAHIRQYGRKIGVSVIKRLAVEFSDWPPNLLQLKKMMDEEVQRNLGRKIGSEFTRRIESVEHPPMKNGEPQGFGKSQPAVNAMHARLDNSCPGWRKEAEKIKAEQGGKQYCEFMFDLMKLKPPQGVRL